MAVFEFDKKLYKLQLGGFNKFCKKTCGEYCKDEDLEFTFEALRSAIDAYQFMLIGKVSCSEEQRKNMQSMIITLCTSLAGYFSG